MSIGGRIRARREELEISRRDLAEAMGIAVSTLSDLELGESKTTSSLHKAATKLRTSVDYLETGRGSKEAQEPRAEYGWADVRGFAQAAGLGTGAEADQYAETYSLKFKSTSLSRKGLHANRLAVFYGKGDSMLPRIKSGDAILFDTSDKHVIDGAIYVVMWRGEYYVKRALVLDDATFFGTDNPNGDHVWLKPKRMDAKRDPIEIIGRVRWIGSWED